MSIDAMKWALQEAPIPHSQTHIRDRLVLVYLADRHNPDTEACWPSVGRIARDLGVSEPTVRNAIRELKDLGLISPASQHWVENYPKGRRPNVWQLHMDRTRPKDGFTPKDLFTPKDVLPPEGERGVSPTPKDVLPPGGKGSLPKPKENPKTTQNTEPKEVVPADASAAPSLFDPPTGKPISELSDAELQPLFEQFWEAYPFRASRQETFKEFRKALDKTTFAVLIREAQEYAEWVRHEGVEWAAVIRSHNWLKKERWADELHFTDRGKPSSPTFNDIAEQTIQEMTNAREGKSGTKELE